MRWLRISWWNYLLKDCKSIRQFFCRIKGHEHVVWYNPGGDEPDMHCSNCGEDLG